MEGMDRMVRIPKGKKDEPLEILWRDACSNDGWRSSEKKEKVLRIMTVGYLLPGDDEEDSISVVQNMGEGTVSCSMTIPRECITSMKRFRRK